MKSAMPFHGVPMPAVRTIARSLVTPWPFGTRSAWEGTVRLVFDEATHREERYVALILVRHPRARAYLDRHTVPLLEHLIATGAWWDMVDDAARAVGVALSADPAGVEPSVRRWIRSSDRWLRRAVIICQLGRREDTNVRLLVDAIEPASGETDFFLRKAVGWALREYGRTDPAWVRDFVARHEGELSTLSKREALRHLVG